MIDWIYIKVALAIMLILLLLEMYDLLVPVRYRPFPCEECRLFEPGCRRVCGPFLRYSAIKRRQDRLAEFFDRLRSWARQR